MSEAKPYSIQAAPIPERYARGWHCLGLASDYTSSPVALDYFGTRLVAYRGDDGRTRVLDGFCPHMGGSLADGEVEGSSIRCPFHRWRWGADGVCDHIPYAKGIPAKARIRSWPTCEENGLLFVWNDPEGGAPSWQVPHLEACTSDDWTDWQIVKWTIETNCRELVDNISDMAHFGPVHGAPVKTFRNRFHKHVAEQLMVGGSELLAESGELVADSAYFGPAYHITHMSGQMEGATIESILLNCHVPIDTGRFDLRFGVIVKKLPGMSEEQNREMATAYVQQSQIAFEQDVAIWHKKVRIDNPLLCDGDGPIRFMRRWYDQFYVDVADVPDTFDEVKEFEYHPNQV